MGIDQAAFMLFSALKKANIINGNVLTLGRQNLLFTSDEVTKMGFGGGGIPYFRKGDFADSYLKWIGFNQIDSIDKSNFEGASILADLCVPLASDYGCKFNCVFDGGTSEHLIDPIQSFRNVANLTKDGGISAWILPGNNQMGHGLWQICPQAFYRIVGDYLGYKQVEVYIIEVYRHKILRMWYVEDPALVDMRGDARNAYSVQVLCVAKKSTYTVGRDINNVAQSDYKKAWSVGAHQLSNHSLRHKVKGYISNLFFMIGAGWLASVLPFRFKRPNYIPVNELEFVNRIKKWADGDLDKI